VRVLPFKQKACSFLQKRTKKRLRLCRASLERPAQALKSFLLLFCKKEALFFLSTFPILPTDPLQLRAFLADMPKGADLHNHLDGAIYAETYLALAQAQGLCQDGSGAITPPPCHAAPPARDAMIDALSMRDFVPSPAEPSGHDHFFKTFARFHAATADTAALLAEEVRRAAAEHILYLEIIHVPRLGEATELAAKTAWHGDDFAADLAALQPALARIVAEAMRDTDQAEAALRARLGCGTPAAEAACRVAFRYLPYSLRTQPEKTVFAQMAFDFALAQADRRYVGVNIVAPEDDPVALRDYHLHMRMLAFFHHRAPDIPLSLHAGELAFGLVPPEDLRFHIRQAMEIAGAARIGHGTSVMYETDPRGLLAELARRHIAIEINQTSNAQILGVAGRNHPFALYRQAGVPVVISTDDAGVERTDLTQEYLHAAQTWHLTYADLKSLSYAALTYSFLPETQKSRLTSQLTEDFKKFEENEGKSARNP
jgi:adenosine deaminase